ncbi:molybdopterin molybdotransferase MoeA [Streptomyces sp. OfavH-34-F]|uniref:molybdopterin molybdotransferase MoeA n=1 Tax=Streptomyces sp. OfavH-34-F TaxID=2917760 RepID=UPI001EF1E6A7|nr:molybdopterin molybdotransferase MoeA [Streptomyces sp. OfavH-34-F]MCG7523144.1 molybdopterin molybdotransferase MoeA [Streptomyces sp. OfavH-34-F]
MAATSPTAAITPLTHPQWPSARRAAHHAARPLPAVPMPLSMAAGCVLAEDLTARTAMPTADSSAMDGWAVQGEPPWRVVGSVLAGRPVGPRLAPGTAVAIATGAALPAGCEAVLRSERGALDAAGLLRTLPGIPSPQARADVRRRGEEAHQGDVLLAAGVRLTPPALGLAAASGNDTVRVHRPAAVSCLVLGDELVTRGVPGPGRVRDALGPQLPLWLAALHTGPVRLRHVPDTFDGVLDRVTAELRTADVLVTTGGSARGPVDHVRACMEQVGGRILVDGVAVRPGHPMMLAQLPDHRWWVALPGNPLAACAAMLTLLEPLVAALRGQPLPRLQQVPLATDVFSPSEDHRLLPYRLDADGFASPQRHSGSAMLRGLATSPGLLVIPPDGAYAGQTVEVLPMPW